VSDPKLLRHFEHSFQLNFCTHFYIFWHLFFAKFCLSWLYFQSIFVKDYSPTVRTDMKIMRLVKKRSDRLKIHLRDFSISSFYCFEFWLTISLMRSSPGKSSNLPTNMRQFKYILESTFNTIKYLNLGVGYDLGFNWSRRWFMVGWD